MCRLLVNRSLLSNALFMSAATVHGKIHPEIFIFTYLTAVQDLDVPPFGEQKPVVKRPLHERRHRSWKDTPWNISIYLPNSCPGFGCAAFW